MKNSIRRVSVTCAAALLCSCAVSQKAGPPPADTPPLPETTGSPITPAPPVERARPVPAPEVPRRPDAGVAPGGTAITVTEFQFSGNTAFSSDVLAQEVRGYVGRPVTLFEIYEAADRVSEFYARHGYSLASVSVPAQRLGDGQVRLEVVEGRVGKVTLEGNSLYTDEQILAHLSATRPGSLYRGDAVRGDLLTLNRLPGLQSKAVLRPGDQYGTSDLLINSTERPVSASAVFDNHGRETIGEYRASVNGVFNNPFRLEDQLQLLVLHSDSALLKYGYAAYQLPAWDTDTRFGLSAGYADFELSGMFSGFEGSNFTARTWLDRSLVRTGDHDFTGTAAVSYTDADANFAGTAVTATEITLFELAGTYNRSYANLAVTQVMLTLSSNFGSGGAIPAKDQPLRTELDVRHLQPVYGRLDAYVRANGVYSDDPLPDITQASLGGPSSVRGYPASAARGDQATFFSTGLRQGFALGRTLLFCRVFGETGKVKNLVVGEESLASAGVGADLYVPIGGYNLAAKVDWSFPESDRNGLTGEEFDDQQVFASISAGF